MPEGNRIWQTTGENCADRIYELHESTDTNIKKSKTEVAQFMTQTSSRVVNVEKQVKTVNSCTTLILESTKGNYEFKKILN